MNSFQILGKDILPKFHTRTSLKHYHIHSFHNSWYNLPFHLHHNQHHIPSQNIRLHMYFQYNLHILHNSKQLPTLQGQIRYHNVIRTQASLAFHMGQTYLSTMLTSKYCYFDPMIHLKSTLLAIINHHY